MTSQTHTLLETALKLTTAERAELASALIASVDGEADADAQGAWDREIERRARRALSGETVGDDWSQVEAEIRKNLRR